MTKMEPHRASTRGHLSLPEIYLRHDGDWLFTDARGDVWRLVPNGDPDFPFTVILEQRGDPLRREFAKEVHP